MGPIQARIVKKSVANEMEAYRLYNVMPALFEFIEDLTNWYIRLNRARFWAEGTTQDKLSAYQTLYEALFELSISMAPFAPFLSETLYQELKDFSSLELPQSVHLCSYPEVSKKDKASFRVCCPTNPACYFAWKTET